MRGFYDIQNDVFSWANKHESPTSSKEQCLKAVAGAERLAPILTDGSSGERLRGAIGGLLMTLIVLSREERTSLVECLSIALKKGEG